MARDQKVDLTKISILQLARQYLQFVERAKELHLDLAADVRIFRSTVRQPRVWGSLLLALSACSSNNGASTNFPVYSYNASGAGSIADDQ